jgi:hypothetical protein
MNRLALKIAGVIVLVLVVIIAAKVFRSAGSVPTIQSPDLKEAQAKKAAEPTELGLAAKIKQEKPTQRVEKLYQKALLQKEKIANSANPNVNYEEMASYCQKILERYPDSPQAEKARELLQEVPEQYRRQYFSVPKVEKSKRLRHRLPRPRLRH